MHQKYVAVRYYTKIAHTQKNTIYSGANLTTVSVRVGIYRVLSSPSISPKRPPHACRLLAYVTFMYSQVSSMQKRAIYSGTNLTTVSVCGGVYRSLSFI